MKCVLKGQFTPESSIYIMLYPVVLLIHLVVHVLVAKFWRYYLHYLLLNIMNLNVHLAPKNCI